MSVVMKMYDGDFTKPLIIGIISYHIMAVWQYLGSSYL